MNDFLQTSELIDWQNPSVFAKAKQLAANENDPLKIIATCFRFVRDDIKHTGDFELDKVPASASEVLQIGTGYCYSKSHLLAALLRANNVMTGLCYQRLALDIDATRFCLHGLNAVYLENGGWFRLDARGLKAGLTAEFTPPKECLPFRAKVTGEIELPEVWAQPLPVVVQALTSCTHATQLAANLPDIEVWS